MTSSFLALASLGDPLADLAALRTAQLLQSSEGLAAELEAEERDEAAALLGRRMRNRGATDAALEELVARAGPERDTELLHYFHRRIQREHELCRARCGRSRTRFCGRFELLGRVLRAGLARCARSARAPCATPDAPLRATSAGTPATHSRHADRNPACASGVDSSVRVP